MNLLAAVCILIGADMFDATFEQANQAYRRGDYAAAIAQYEQLVTARVDDAVVHYNLGNAYHGAGSPGRAIAQYERALQLDPGLEAARQNLETVLGTTQRNLPRPLSGDAEQALFFWAENLSFGTVFALAGLLWVAFWALLCVRAWRPVKFLRLAAVLLGMLACLGLGAAWSKSHPVRLAVAAQAEVPVFFGKNPDEPPRFVLYEGDRVRVERSEAGWALVSTAGGDRGWVQDDRMAFVGAAVSAAHSADQAPTNADPAAEQS